MPDFTDEEKARIQETQAKFVDFINDLVRTGQFYIYCIPDMMAVIYLRLRMYMTDEQAQSYIDQSMEVVERHIQEGKIQTMLPDGTPITYRPVEEDDGANDLLKHAEYEVTDEDLNRLLDDGV